MVEDMVISVKKAISAIKMSIFWHRSNFFRASRNWKVEFKNWSFLTKNQGFSWITKNYPTDIFNILGTDAPSNYASNGTKHIKVGQKFFDKKFQAFSSSELEKYFGGNFQNFRVRRAIYRFSRRRTLGTLLSWDLMVSELGMVLELSLKGFRARNRFGARNGFGAKSWGFGSQELLMTVQCHINSI